MSGAAEFSCVLEIWKKTGNVVFHLENDKINKCSGNIGGVLEKGSLGVVF